MELSDSWVCLKKFLNSRVLSHLWVYLLLIRQLTQSILEALAKGYKCIVKYLKSIHLVDMTFLKNLC